MMTRFLFATDCLKSVAKSGNIDFLLAYVLTEDVDEEVELYLAHS